MTIGAQVKQTIASLKGLQSTLKSFAILESNHDASQVYQGNAEVVASVISEMEQRLQKLEFKEPQYKGF